MKKIFSFFALAAMAIFAFSCNADKKGVDVDDIVEDGVYVMFGNSIEASYAMAIGINEANSQTPREGMYEKYIVLDADQEFTLAYKAGDNTTKYGAELAEEVISDGDNPTDPVLKGVLVEGDSAPAMKVAKKALYHIVLDLNLDGNLDNAQILVSEVTWGVRGGMNNWGFTALNATDPSNDGITYTLSGQELGNNGEFKFAYNGAWKITLATDKVKANTNLGADGKPGGDNIVVTEGAGKYKITLTFKLAGGDVAKSFSYTTELESKADFPEHVYMTGSDFGGWSWGSEGIVEATHISAGGGPKDGVFALIRYIKHDNPVKFSTINVADDWSKSFGGMTNNSENCAFDGDGNLVVPSDGLWTITIDYTKDMLTLQEGKVFGLGPCFGDGENWETDKATEGTVNADGTVTIKTDLAGTLRTFAPCAYDWWQFEFQPTAEGGIFYREGADSELTFTVEAGATITYDFNAGTATVK